MQILRFGLVGAAATLIHMAFATALIIAVPPIHPLLANVLAFLAAFLVSFVGHSRFTFRSKGNLSRFLVAALSGLAANNIILIALLTLGIPGLVAVWFGTLAAPIIVFLIAKYWAFSTHA